MNVAASTKAENYSRIPTQAELKLTPGAAYVHMTSNNTIEGTEYQSLPEVGDAPLVSDTSSDMFSHPIDVSRYGLIYAGAQKNIGPSGVTIVIIRDDLLARSAEKKATLPTMLNYAVHAENGSLYNTPGTFAIYVARARDEVAGWRRAASTAIAKINERKAREAVRGDRSHRVLSRHGRKEDRSLMNVTFRLPNEDLEKTVREGIDGGGPRRPEGPPLGRRHARVDLQRVSGSRRRRARRVHEGIRAQARVASG